MSFVRTVKKENPFVQIDKYFFDVSSLSWSAKGLLGYILSKPDNWQIRKEDLIKKSADGKEKIESAMLELLTHGYLNWYQEKDENGHFSDWIYEVYERPEFNPNMEKCKAEGERRIQERKERNKAKNNKKKPKVDNPPAEKPKVDNPPADNPPYSNNDFSNNDLKKEEEEERINNLLSFFSKNITTSGSEVVKKKLAEWLLKLPYTVIMAELETCSLYGAKTWNYIEKALKDDLKRNIATLEQLEAKYREYNEKKQESQKKKPVVNKGGKVLPIRKEILPDWFNEGEYKKPVVTEQETIDFEIRKKELQETIKRLRAK